MRIPSCAQKAEVLITLCLVLTMFLTVSCCAADEKGLVLSRDGKTNYVIVVPDVHSPVVKTASIELSTYLNKITGAKFAVKSESQVDVSNSPVIFVGPCKLVNELLQTEKIDLGLPDSDTIFIRTSGENLLLAGSQKRGTLYAVYTFLEDVAGVRWWTSSVEFVPKKQNFSIPALNIHYSPKIKFRGCYYKDARKVPFAARLKVNGHFPKLGDEYGGHYKVLGFCHTFNQLLPASKYFVKHPDWYSYQAATDERLEKHTQLCLTNTEMRKEFTKQALKWVRDNPNAGYIAVSQNDFHNACECKACKAVLAEEGAQSGVILRFVNAVAKDIEKEFPDFKVVTLAYQYTEEPPKKTRPRGNVVVQLCSIESSFAQPLGSGPQNKKFSRNLSGWRKIAPRLFIWDYLANFSNYLLPYPNYLVLGPNMREFQNSGAVGVFAQGDALSVTGDFVFMRAWVVGHLLWNPNADADALRREFLTGYYGKAGPVLEEYLMSLCEELKKTGARLRCDRSETSTWLSLAGLNRAAAIFDRAQEAVKGDSVLSERVDRARIPLDNAWLEYLKKADHKKVTQMPDYRGPKDISVAIEQFLLKTQKYGTAFYSENERFSYYKERLRLWQSTLGKDAPLPAALVSLKDNITHMVKPWDFNVNRSGKWAILADDKTSPFGKAIKMPGNHNQWALQYRFPESLLGTWHLYLQARCDVLENYSGQTMTCGLYDKASQKETNSLMLASEKIQGSKYKLLYMGNAKITGDTLFFAAPAGSADNKTPDVWVGRLILSRKKAVR